MRHINIDLGSYNEPRLIITTRLETWFRNVPLSLTSRELRLGEVPE